MPGEPLDVGHAVPVGCDEADGSPVVPRKLGAIHLVAEQVRGAHGVLERHAAGESLGHGQVEAPRAIRGDLARLATTDHTRVVADRHLCLVGTPEDHLDPLVEGPRALEDLGQRRAGPPCVADQADLVRRGVAVAGTLQRERHDSTRKGTEVGQRQGLWPRDESVDAQAPVGRRELRHVVVLDREELPVGRQVLDVLPHQRVRQVVHQKRWHRRDLVQPWDDDPLVDLRERLRRTLDGQHRQSGHRCGRSSLQDGPAGYVQVLHGCARSGHGWTLAVFLGGGPPRVSPRPPRLGIRLSANLAYLSVSAPWSATAATAAVRLVTPSFL